MLPGTFQTYFYTGTYLYLQSVMKFQVTFPDTAHIYKQARAFSFMEGSGEPQGLKCLKS